MGKLKEALAEIVEYFDWEGFIICFCLAFALCAFILGIVLSIAFKNLAWVALWPIGIIAVAVAKGVGG